MLYISESRFCERSEQVLNSRLYVIHTLANQGSASEASRFLYFIVAYEVMIYQPENKLKVREKI